MIYFTPDFFDFFQQLSQNNNKAWMDAHKKIFEEAVKFPFRRLVSDFLEKLYELEPTFPTQKPEHCIFRINRDIRFSSNKEPYKTHVAAYFCRGGKKSERPGFYIHLSAQDSFVGGGCYELSSSNLKKIRQQIYSCSQEFMALVNEPSFLNTFGEIQGTKNKVLPKEYKKVAQQIPLLYNKQYYFLVSLSKEQILGQNLLELLTSYYRIALPILKFFENAFLIEDCSSCSDFYL
ncbi:MAG: DUF2461 domain-containing protein [Bacteroidia bacterium]|nr:DUF2461 domain-containing protein [Bacteroidia bacterium]MDW8158182.1 DUF2461 domain-containing protein [Bacteroidia bacterium]